MTALAIGKKNKITFAVIDAMVHGESNIKSYKDCRLVDKTTFISSSNQYILLCGEELIVHTALLLNDWCIYQNLELNLFNENNFFELLKCAEIYRIFCIEVQNFNLITQNVTDFYVINANNIKHYNITQVNGKYIINAQLVFPDNLCIMNFKGRTSEIKIDVDKNVIANAIKILKNEQSTRTLINSEVKATPLQYSFEERVTGIKFIDGVEYIYPNPYRTFTELLLSQKNCWDFVRRPDIKFNPKIV